MQQQAQETISAAAAKATPPVAVAGAHLSGYSLSDWVLAATLVYTVLQIVLVVRRLVLQRRASNGKEPACAEECPAVRRSRNESGMAQPRVLVAVAIATAIAVPAEGLRQKAYYDPPGVLSVCYGSTTNIDPRKLYSIEECKSRLDAEMLAAVETVERCVPGLPVPVLAAFGDAVYNLGERIACNRSTSTAARMLSAGDLQAACNELPRWNRARVLGVKIELPGLTNRRAAEQQLCLKGA